MLHFYGQMSSQNGTPMLRHVVQGKKEKKTPTTNDALLRMCNLKEDRMEYFEFVAPFVLQIRC